MTTAQLVTPCFTSNIHKFSVQQYQLMHEAGVFAVGDRYELINGEIRNDHSQPQPDLSIANLIS